MAATDTSSAPAVIAARARWRPSPAGMLARGAVLLVILGAVLSTPLLVRDAQVNIVSTAVVYAIVALSLNVLIGYTGQISLGHAAFVGVGAFSAGIALTTLGLPWAFGLVFAAAIGAVAALLLGGIALRIKGLFLALVTVAYGLFAERVLFGIDALTGGGAGMNAFRPAWASGDLAYAYVCFAALALVWLFDWRLTASKAGRAIQALRDDERVAATWGINVAGFKLLAFVISGVIAGIAGALFASIEQLITPQSFSFTLSLTFVLMTVIGGVGSRPGVVQGGIVFAVLGAILETFGLNPLLVPLIGALLLLATLLFFPGGIAQQQTPLLRWLSFKPLHADHHTATSEAGETEPAARGA